MSAPAGHGHSYMGKFPCFKVRERIHAPAGKRGMNGIF